MSSSPNPHAVPGLQNAHRCHLTFTISLWDRIRSSHCKNKENEIFRREVKATYPVWYMAEQAGTGLMGRESLNSFPPIGFQFLTPKHMLSSLYLRAFGQSDFHIAGYACSPTAKVKHTEPQSTPLDKYPRKPHLLETIQEKTHFWLVSVNSSLCFRNRCWCWKARMTGKPDAVSLKKE